MRVVDANVLIYAVNSETSRHDVAKSWLDDALRGREPVAFCWNVLLAFLRITTHSTVFSRPLTAAEASDAVEAWLAQPAAVIIEPTSRHHAVLRGLLAKLGTAGNLVNEAHIAALAVEHDATVASFDNDFERFTGVRRCEPSTTE